RDPRRARRAARCAARSSVAAESVGPLGRGSRRDDRLHEGRDQTPRAPRLRSNPQTPRREEGSDVTELDPMLEKLGRAPAPELEAKIRGRIGTIDKVRPLASPALRAAGAALLGITIAAAVAWAAGVRPLPD